MKSIHLPSRNRPHVQAVACFLLGLLSSAAVVKAGSSPVGWVDMIDSNGTVAGWARDPDSPNKKIDVHFYFDGVYYCGGANARYFHDSVVGYHGFRFTLPENVRAGQHWITVYGIDVTGDPPATIGNGNPFPTQVNVAANDNCREHVTGGTAQIGPSSSSALVGGRPNNKALASQSLGSPWAYVAAPGTLWWYQTGDTPFTVTAATRLAGGISSIIWDNVEFVDSGGHGAALQYNLHNGANNELFNPNEAGSTADDCFAWYNQSIINLNPLNSTNNPPDPGTGGLQHVYQNGSSSALIAQNTTDYPGFIHTNQRMAYFVPKPPNGISVWNGHPKPANTIYAKEWCALNLANPPPLYPPNNPPGYNANAAFYSIFPPYGPGTATHTTAPSDTLDATYYEGVEPISDYFLDKRIGLGAIANGSVTRIQATVTVPSGVSNNGNWNLYVFPDHIRFHTRTGARTLFYTGGGYGAVQQQTGTSGATLGAAIVSDPENRYAIAAYTRRNVTGQQDVYQFYQQDSTYVEIGTTMPYITGGASRTMVNYVVVGTLAGVVAQLDTLMTANPAP